MLLYSVRSVMSCCIIINIIIKIKYTMPTNEILHIIVNTSAHYHHHLTNYVCFVIYLIMHEMIVVSMNTINASLFQTLY